MRVPGNEEIDDGYKRILLYAGRTRGPNRISRSDMHPQCVDSNGNGRWTGRDAAILGFDKLD